MRPSLSTSPRRTTDEPQPQHLLLSPAAGPSVTLNWMRNERLPAGQRQAMAPWVLVTLPPPTAPPTPITKTASPALPLVVSQQQHAG